jgi:hypothetical protein
MARLSILFLVFSVASFGQVSQKKSPLLADSSVNLYAFVGQKISLIEYDPNADYSKPMSIEIDSTSGDTLVRRRSYVMDKAFDADYKVVQALFNDLKTDTVSFKVFDHYGRPAFEKYSTVLLYISKSKDGTHYFHQKYQFDPLFRGKNGSWVGEHGESLEELFNQRKKTIFNL